jgi:hypothetical protein
MIKHVGKHNSRKVVILYRTVPNETHMALVAYSDSLPRIVHDMVMQTLEAQTGQQADQLADALFRTTLADGTNTLNTLHSAGLIKKIPTSQIIVTPTSSATIRLDELNDMLEKMKGGEEAVKKMADLDNSRGMKNSNKPLPRDVGEPNVVDTTSDVLTDDALAAQRVAQATTMKAEAARLIVEATRLEAEAKELAPTKRKINASKKAKTQTF